MRLHVLLNTLSIILYAAGCLAAVARNRKVGHAASKKYYQSAHSLGEYYKFDPRDGWDTINTTDLPYKYQKAGASNETSFDGLNSVDRRQPKQRISSKKNALPNKLGGPTIGGAIKAIGDAILVTITWYTGHDLENPSCWANGDWAPTDSSFVGAVTLEGWATRPKCFKFLELCNGPKKCIFVRIVDTCAGCAKGSKHVDLTREAFSTLASLDAGILGVQMRLATDPDEWFEDLWGPKSQEVHS